MLNKEAEEAGEEALQGLKQRVFASAFGSIDSRNALAQYYKLFEEVKEEHDYEVEQYEPESEEDVLAMLGAARRAGAIS